ncbi:MAG: ABC transporter permease [Bacteroidales bacterium]|nr:ABC transporter permease [Lentimicrobiaceae bacterium]MDD5696030.1 ABC transporter permease [Bacteroidales bacterium]
MFDADRWNEIFYTLRKNKLRTFFTAFGVFWGIFMLVIMMGSGNGLRNAVFYDFGNMAANSVFMWTQRTTMPYKGFQRGRYFNFRNNDTQALKEKIPEIDLIAPRIQAWGGGGANNVIRNDRTSSFTIFGDYPEIQLIDPLNMIEGRFINKLDIDQRRKVAVIGAKVKNDMFETWEDPIGEYLKIQGVYFQVVGVFESKKSDQQAERENQVIFLPFTSLQQTYNYGDIVGWYAFTSHPDVPASVVETKAKRLLAERHSIHPEDQRAIGSFNLEKEYKKMTGLFTGIRILIWIVGAGTLFAGVVGVSNIMLIVVRERTKEIGIQRAIGATPWNIMSQVITESVILTTAAGYIGLVIGVGIIEGVNIALAKAGTSSNMFRNPEIDFQMAMVALAILVISGMLAGMIPARRAVSIKPIDAIRFE